MTAANIIQLCVAKVQAMHYVRCLRSKFKNLFIFCEFLLSVDDSDMFLNQIVEECVLFFDPGVVLCVSDEQFVFGNVKLFPLEDSSYFGLAHL